MIQQLDPPLPLTTPQGPGLAHFVIDYGPESHLLWVVFLDADGACWTVPNPEVRMAPNWTMGRRPMTGLPIGRCRCATAAMDAPAVPDAAAPV